MSVEVAAGSVVVLGGSWVGVPGEDLGVAEGDAGVEGVGDRGVPQRVWADVSWDACGFRDPGDHAVNVAPINRVAGDWPQHQRPCRSLATASLKDAEDRDGQWHGGGLVAFADQS